MPQEEGRHIRCLGGQLQAARSRQIQAFRRAPWRDHHGADARDLQRIGSAAQHIPGRRAAHDQKPLRVEAQHGEARRVDAAIFRGRDILLQPDHRPGGIRSAQGKRQGEAHGRAGVTCLRRAYLVQRTPPQPAGECPIRLGKTQCEDGAARAIPLAPLAINGRNSTPQRRKIDGAHNTNPANVLYLF